jgi:predicted aconitase with swiveling domain
MQPLSFCWLELKVTTNGHYAATIVVAAVPTVVAATAVIAPPMPVAAVDLNDCSVAAQRMGCCCGHS